MKENQDFNVETIGERKNHGAVGARCKNGFYETEVDKIQVTRIGVLFLFAFAGFFIFINEMGLIEFLIL